MDNVSHSIKDSKSLEYKTNITGKLEGIDTTKTVEIVVPLKYLSNFWRALEILVINCEVSLTLTWSANFVITNKVYRGANPGANPVVVGLNNPTNATFKITDSKLYAPVVTLLTQDDNKLLQQLKQDLKELLNGINTDQKCQTKCQTM